MLMPRDVRNEFEIVGVADLAGFVMPVRLIAHVAGDQVGGLAAGMGCPAADRLGEIDVEYDPAEIEQKRIGRAGKKQGRCHG